MATIPRGCCYLARQIDSELIESPDTKLLPGRQVKWEIAFAVKNPRDLVLEIGPAWAFQEPALFTTT